MTNNRSLRAMPHLVVGALFLVTLGSLGCSGKPSRISQPKVKPGKAASLAMEEYDTNGDGAIDEQEIVSSPGLMAAKSQFDKNGDGHIQESEVEARLQQWIKTRKAIFAIPCIITLNGRPIPNAEITFEPESFLGDSFRTLEITTDSTGAVDPPALENFPVKGYPLGLYRVRVSKKVGNEELLPEKYNQQTVLGQEIASGAAGMSHGLSFQLSTEKKS